MGTVKSNGCAGIEDIARKLEMSRTTVRHYIGRLEAARKARVDKFGQMKRVRPFEAK